MPSDLIRGSMPVRVKKTRQNKRLEKAEAQICEAVADDLHRSWPKAQTFRHQGQVAPQLGLALPDPVSDLAAIEDRKSGTSKLPPGVSLQFFQRIYVAT
jgi:hypothetical protein